MRETHPIYSRLVYTSYVASSFVNRRHTANYYKRPGKLELLVWCLDRCTGLAAQMLWEMSFAGVEVQRVSRSLPNAVSVHVYVRRASMITSVVVATLYSLSRIGRSVGGVQWSRCGGAAVWSTLSLSLSLHLSPSFSLHPDTERKRHFTFTWAVGHDTCTLR